MSDRKYSLAEIDEMRWSIAWIRAEQTRFLDHVTSNTVIENLLRTYMMAGIEPTELAAAAKKAEAEIMARSRAVGR